MQTKIAFAGFALALAAMPMLAQTGRDRIPTRTPTSGRVILGVPTNDRVSTRSATRIPPGQLPPKGMCRVWIDGVPPGQQPAVTDCASAERNRVANSRVIYGDRESFPGKGKGKFKGAANGNVSQSCSSVDGVVVGSRVVNVCRDANGNVIRRAGDKIRRDGRDDDEQNEEQNDQLSSRKNKPDKSEKLKGKSGRHGKSG